jgi:hypothetical protein
VFLRRRRVLQLHIVGQAILKWRAIMTSRESRAIIGRLLIRPDDDVAWCAPVSQVSGFAASGEPVVA